MKLEKVLLTGAPLLLVLTVTGLFVTGVVFFIMLIIKDSSSKDKTFRNLYREKNNWNIHETLPFENKCDGTFSTKADARVACESRSDCVGFVNDDSITSCGKDNRYELRGEGLQTRSIGTRSWIKLQKKK